MGITRLDLSDFRNFVSIKLEPLLTGFNFIYGKNGSGKTSLLEAIYYLSVGRSFRSALSARIVRKNTSKFSLFAHIETENEQNIPIGIERDLDGGVKIRIRGKDAQFISELANVVPVQLINSQSYNLLDAGPQFRRKYLDWGAYYATPDFLRLWRQYERALKQRNAALRAYSSEKELNSWTESLTESAYQLNSFRKAYVEQLLPGLRQTVEELLNLNKLTLEYLPGWDETLSYAEALKESLDKDRRFGFTQVGPHRADFKITIDRAPAKDILSRGQQKLFVCAMILAQGSLLKRAINKGLIYLIDDLPSELDTTSKSRLIALLSKQEAQVFVTAVEREILTEFLGKNPVKMFHVEHGNIMEVE